jgi:hypothetical protein
LPIVGGVEHPEVPDGAAREAGNRFGDLRKGTTCLFFEVNYPVGLHPSLLQNKFLLFWIFIRNHHFITLIASALFII